MATMIKVKINSNKDTLINLDNVVMIKPYRRGHHVYFSLTDKIYISTSRRDLCKILESIYE